MTIPGFGNIMTVHWHVLSLIGWRLTRGGSQLLTDEAERIDQMRAGHADLVRMVGQDFGYDLAKWREFLMDEEQFSYRHPYGFKSVDRAVQNAIADAGFARLAALAAEGGPEWDAQYRARLERERQARMAKVAAKDVRITDNKCPACGMPLPTYRVTCKHCGRQVRERR